MYAGDFNLEKSIHVMFTTRSFSTGVPTTLAGTPAVEIYEDNSTTQITAAETLTVDFDAITGLNHLLIAATAANGFEAGKFYHCVISAGTVGGVSVVGEVVASFSIQAGCALRPTTADRTLDVSAGGEAGLDWANIGSPTTAQNLSATNIDVDQVVASVSGAVGSVTGAVGSVAAGGITASSIAADAIGASELAADAVTEIANAVWDTDATGRQTAGTFGQAIGDPGADTNTIFKAVVTDAAGATVGVDIVAVKAETASIQVDTDDIQTRLPAALVGGRIDASVGAMAANVLTAAATAADFTTEVTAGLATAAALDAVDNFVDTEIADIQARLPAALVGGRMDASVGAMAANTLTASALAADAANEIADALLDRADAVETGLTHRQAMRLIAAASAGKLSGAATTTIVIRNAVADSVDRITATVDADGNRSAITYNL